MEMNGSMNGINDIHVAERYANTAIKKLKLNAASDKNLTTENVCLRIVARYSKTFLKMSKMARVEASRFRHSLI